MTNPPYTDNKVNTNHKPRLVTCPKCLYDIETDLPNPKCGDCKSQLITIIPGMME
jgi:Zn finger protein HypA/HybF involved in hydrogenase expression